MAENSSSSDSLLQSNLSSILTDLPFSICLIRRPGSFIFLGFFITNILLLLPLCILIIYLGLDRWRKQRSTSMAANTSHSDSFTYHMVTMELVGVLGQIVCCCGVFSLHVKTYWVGFCLWLLSWYGEIFFNVLTCVERYLAVIHPVTYLSLKSERGIQIRNICIGCVWLLSLGEVGLLTLKNISAGVEVFVFAFCLIVISFCSLSVLCVLIRPGPGEQRADGKKVDQSKQRAFLTIVTILGVLSLRFVWNLTRAFLFEFRDNLCVIMGFGVWLNIPSSLVIPLLFLHRTGFLVCTRNAK